MDKGDGQPHTPTVLEQLREASKGWLIGPVPHLDPKGEVAGISCNIRWVIAASASVAVGYAAMDAAIANYPDQRFTLRNGILMI